MVKSPWENEEIALMGLTRMNAIAAVSEVDFLESELEFLPGLRILDLGCGPGYHSVELARRGYQVIGVDVSPVLIDKAERLAATMGVRASFSLGNMATWEWTSDQKLDCVLCLHESGFGELGGEEADLGLLRRVRNWLTPNGHFVISTFNAILRYRSLSPAFNHVNSTVRWEAPLSSGWSVSSLIRVYTPSELRLMLSVSGFSNVKQYGAGRGNFRRAPISPDDIEMMAIARAG